MGNILWTQGNYSEAEELFQQALRRQEKALGKDHVDTLYSKYMLGRTLYCQDKYSEAEKQLRLVVHRQEKELGKDHKDTLKSKYWLGSTLYDQKKHSKAKELLQQAARGQEKKLGKNHKDTLESKYWLGRTVYFLEEYSEAEELLQQAVHGYEKNLGQDHADTLSSKYWLGLTLYNREKYSEAEELLQQAVHGYEKNYGKDHEDTLSSKYWLGCTLCDQEKYREAEEMLRQAVHGYEKNLGIDHADTAYGKYWLGCILYDQEKYSEAKELLQQAVHGYEKNYGKDHEDTLSSKYWLGCTLYDQEKYREAEEMLRQAVHGYEKNLGIDHVDTVYSKYWLGRTLYDQEKYSEAEELLQQAVHGCEKELGKDHEDTLRSKYWLGCTLHKQEKYREAEEMLQQAAHGQEKELGKDHADTITTIHKIHKIQLNFSSSLPTNITTQNLASRLNSFFPEGRDSQVFYTDSKICEISSLLERLNPRWNRVPRTYIVLRTIGYLNLLNEFIDVGFSDYWFPVTERNLPPSLRPSVRAAFVSAQSLVLTESMDLERSENGRHCYFKQGESPPFETKGILGNGGFGQVDKVLSLISFKEYARKRVLRSFTFRGRRKEDIKQFVAEIEILKRLKHRHIVEFVGSYTDAKYIGLIMSPIAEMDLSAYLKRSNASNHHELRTFFGCLARALEFLHEQKVRHKDIKPGNILVDRGNILFADFGLSFDFKDANGSTTMSMVNGMTPRYCAPEVALQESRNTMSDIWSLGVVFMEMIVILKGKTIQYMDEFFRQHGSPRGFIRTNLATLPEFITELEGIGELSDNRALGWTQQMLLAEQQLRPTASSLVTSITASNNEGESMGFCGICCVSSEEFSDWVDE